MFNEDEWLSGSASRFHTTVCGRNEEFKECGSACPPSCAHRQGQRRCEEKCVRGCFCRDGFLRDPSGKCVPPTSCPVVCESNEVFKECGSACPPTCTNRRGQRQCQERCVRGCFCRDGLVRDPAGKCVPLTMCPSVAEYQLSSVVVNCPPQKRSLVQSTSEQTHMGKDHLLTIEISDYRSSVENVELSPRVQHNAFPDDNFKATIMVSFRAVTGIKPCPDFSLNQLA
ncbi:hypothetical protein TNCV_3868101 [Trichonephila clavipes]|nr:hypothetical protein TNCV_3868101 [Trichonephila clavipes]